MPTTVQGRYRHGRVELVEEPAGVEEANVLVTFLPAPVADVLPGPPRPLYGAWKGKVPNTFDVEETLKEIRAEWQREWEEDASG